MVEPKKNSESKPKNANNKKRRLSGVKRYKKGRSFADTLFGKMRYGKDLLTEQWVAIKENRKWFAQNRVSIKGDPVPEDLFKEIEIMKYLMSNDDLPPEILKLLNVVEDDVYIYLVLELIDSGDFFAFIHNNHQKMENEQTNSNLNNEWQLRMKRVFYSMVCAIKWLHFKNVAHLDLSLENALIDDSDHIKIIDFGLSIHFTDASTAFMMQPKRIGKPRCMSPEVFNCEAFDARSADTWSVAIMLFMMLLGIPPWTIPNGSETIFRMIKCGRIRDVVIYNNKNHLISDEALDLLTRLFKAQNQRIYLDQVLKHPFCSF